MFEMIDRMTGSVAHRGAGRLGERGMLALAAAANVLGLVVVCFGAYVLGGYALEHVGRESVARDVLEVVWALLALAGLLATAVTIAGRPRRFAARRLGIGVAGALFVWPAAIAALLGTALLSYPGELDDIVGLLGG